MKWLIAIILDKNLGQCWVQGRQSEKNAYMGQLANLFEVTYS